MVEQESFGPESVTDSNVQFWSRHTKELKYAQIKKALQLLTGRRRGVNKGGVGNGI
jgi:hypothetical protein